jgi:hypothetical protein
VNLFVPASVRPAYSVSMIIWQKELGQIKKQMSFGEGESPYLYADKLFIQ